MFICIQSVHSPPFGQENGLVRASTPAPPLLRAPRGTGWTGRPAAAAARPVPSRRERLPAGRTRPHARTTHHHGGGVVWCRRSARPHPATAAEQQTGRLLTSLGQRRRPQRSAAAPRPALASWGKTQSGGPARRPTYRRSTRLHGGACRQPCPITPRQARPGRAVADEEGARPTLPQLTPSTSIVRGDRRRHPPVASGRTLRARRVDRPAMDSGAAERLQRRPPPWGIPPGTSAVHARTATSGALCQIGVGLDGTRCAGWPTGKVAPPTLAVLLRAKLSVH